MRSEWRELPFTEAVEVNPKVFLKMGSTIDPCILNS